MPSLKTRVLHELNEARAELARKVDVADAETLQQTVKDLGEQIETVNQRMDGLP